MVENIEKNEHQCIICLNTLSEPVTDSEGNTWDLPCLRAWYKLHHISPTSKNYISPNVVCNVALCQTLGIDIPQVRSYNLLNDKKWGEPLDLASERRRNNPSYIRVSRTSIVRRPERTHRIYTMDDLYESQMRRENVWQEKSSRSSTLTDILWFIILLIFPFVISFLSVRFPLVTIIFFILAIIIFMALIIKT